MDFYRFVAPALGLYQVHHLDDDNDDDHDDDHDDDKYEHHEDHPDDGNDDDHEDDHDDGNKGNHEDDDDDNNGDNHEDHDRVQVSWTLSLAKFESFIDAGGEAEAEKGGKLFLVVGAVPRLADDYLFSQLNLF